MRGRQLVDLARELQRQAEAKKDFVVPADRLEVRSNGHSELVIDDRYVVNDVAHTQIADYVGVPRTFYDRMRGQTEDLRVSVYREHEFQDLNEPLFDVTVNTLLKSKGQDGRLVRTLDGKARAFLSDTYNPDIDNYDVYCVAAKALDESGIAPDNIISAEVTEKRLYLKVVSPQLQATVRPQNLANRHGLLREPQVVQAGFVLMNSETGLGALAVKQVVYKLMCTNMWIMETAYRQRHVGKLLETDEDGAIYRSETRMADAKARLLKLRDHISEALNEHKFMALVAKMQESSEIVLQGSIEKVVDTTARKFSLTVAEKELVLRNLIEGADLTLWGLSNAVTATAHTVESYDRATELEAIGGQFFQLPTADIRQLVEAA